MSPPVVAVDAAAIGGLLARIEPRIEKDDHAMLCSIANTLVEVTRLAHKRGTTIARLRSMLGQRSSEKTADVCGVSSAPGMDGASPSATNANGAPAPGAEPAAVTVAPEPNASDSGAKEPIDAAPNREGAGKERPRRPDGRYGRFPASAYEAECIAVAHPTLCAGDKCPECARGTLYAQQDPVSSVRLFGQAPLVAVRWDCDCYRCNSCGHCFTAPLPEQGRGPKCSESAAATLVTLRYGMGMPLHRLARMQTLAGVPIAASTQWEIARDHVQDVMPVYDALVTLAANAPLVHNDDTYVRVLSLMGKRRRKLIELGLLDQPERTGLFTTGFVACVEAGPIALFSSGRQHAGENFADLLDMRDPRLPPPMQMCDGLDRNQPANHRVVLANCLAHARRHVVDEIDNHPELCEHILGEIAKVFAHDAHCRDSGITGPERLIFHQQNSGPVLDDLKSWMDGLVLDKRVEPNSGLGKALSYIQDRWNALTLFLRATDAPICNNLVERILKKAIRQRRASLFFRTPQGALVSDVYTALIVTTELHEGDPRHYLEALLTHRKAVAAKPDAWLPWNYREELARVEPALRDAA